MTTFEDSAWDGSPGNWDTAEDFCNDCLIDLNTDTPKIKSLCKLPFRKPGSSAVNKGALRAIVGGRGITAVKDVPQPELKRAANRVIRLFQEAFGRPAPDSVFRIAGRAPKTKALIHKDKSGQLWFFGIYTNNFEDSDGDILSWKSHLDYKRWMDETGVKLPIITAHLPKYPLYLHMAQFINLKAGRITAEEFSENYLKLYAPTAFAQTETIIPMDGFVFVVGKILENKKDVAELLHKSGLSWGMSHGFISTERKDGVIEKYRTFEFSILPETFVANRITAFDILEEKTVADEFKGLSDEDREALEVLLEGSVEDTEAAIQAAKTILEGVVASKSSEDIEVEDTKPEEYEKLRDRIFTDLNTEGLSDTLKSIGEAFETMEQRLEALEKQTQKTEDELIAEQFSAPLWGMVAKQQEDQTEEELEILKEGAVDKGTITDKGSDADIDSNILTWAAGKIISN